jgi:triphosphoribosyl-dephospho-CoA synthetase
MSKEQEALDYLKEKSAYEVYGNFEGITQKGVESVNNLQELIDKHEKLREYLIEEFNKVLSMNYDNNLSLFANSVHYRNGLQFALDYLNKGDTDE